MTKIYIFTIAIFILLSCSTSQKVSSSITTFSLSVPKLDEIEKIEKSLNSVEKKTKIKIGLSEDYFPGVKKYDFAQPKIYIRKNGTLKTVVSYFYTQNDNQLRLVEYAWDQIKDGDSIKNIYAKNEKFLNKYFGKIGSLTLNTDPEYWQEKLSWENENIYAYQFILGSEEKVPYRTRLIIRKK